MAQMTIYETDAFNDLWNMDFGGYATETLNECAPVLESKMKAIARTRIQHEGESEMIDSIKPSKAKKASNGAYIVNVGPRGYSKTKKYYAKNGKKVHTKRSYSVSNALKAIWKEYGIPNRQPAQPFISTAVSQCESQIYERLQKAFEQKVKI